MIKEIVKPTDRYINIEIPQEYVGNELEVLIFSSNEVENIKEEQSAKKLLDEFKKATKNRIKPKIKYHLKMEDEVNNDIWASLKTYTVHRRQRRHKIS